MCRLKNIRLQKLKFVCVFAVTFLISLSFNAYFGRYTFYYAVTEVFTKSEINKLKGKRVSDTCFKISSQGTITDFNKYGVEITYDEPVIANERKVISRKQTFERCSILID